MRAVLQRWIKAPRSHWLTLLPYEVWVAVAAIYTGLSYLIPPLRTFGNAQLVAAAHPRLALVWSLLYTLGGVAMIVGLARRSPRIEGFGLHLFGSGVTVAYLASLYAGVPVVPATIIQGGVIIATIYRLKMLKRIS